MTHGHDLPDADARPDTGGVAKESTVSDIKTKAPRRTNVRGHRAGILLMSEEERRQKAADILATGLIKLLQGGKAANTDDEVPHAQG